MFTRRHFIKVIAAAWLPIGRSHACGTDELPYSRQRIAPLSQNESLPEFVTRYVGHSDWLMDDDNIVDVRMNVSRDQRFNPDNRSYLYPENNSNVSFSVGLREYQDRYKCASIDILLENSLTVDTKYQNAIKSNNRTYRSKIATFSFPTPGLISSISHYKIDFKPRGKVICISRFVDTTGGLLPKTFITVSKEMRQLCGGEDYEFAPSYKEAVLSCERLKYRAKGAQTQAVFDEYTSKLLYECIDDIKSINKL